MGVVGYRKPGLGPTCPAKPHDIVWAAGVFEGDGHCYFIGGHTERSEVTQKWPWLLEKLRSLFGGSVYLYEDKKGMPRWVLTGPRARGFLMSIYEFLSPRRQEQVHCTMRWEER